MPAPKRRSSSGTSSSSNAQRLEAAAGPGPPEPHVDRGGGDVQVLGAGQVGEEREDRQHMAPTRTRAPGLAWICRPRTGARAPWRPATTPPANRCSPSAIRVACHSSSVSTIVAISARIRSASPRWLPSKRPGVDDLADVQRGDHADQHEHREQVDEQRVPALVAQPRKRRVLVDDRDHRDHDRRRQHQEAPEDERMHQPRAEALEQLALAEHDRRLVLDPPSGCRRRGTTGCACRATRPDQQADPAAEQRAADDHRGSKRDGGDRRDYVPFAFRISALIAGRISCRSPITA